MELDGIRSKVSDPLRGEREGGIEFASKMVGVDVQLSTEWEVGV